MKDTGDSYTDTRIFKIKPPELNTIDVKLKLGDMGVYYATAVFSRSVEKEIVVRLPLLVSGEINHLMPVVHNDSGYIEGAIYECEIDPRGFLIPIRHRQDKQNPNSILAIMDGFGCQYLPPWLDNIKDTGQIGFYDKKMQKGDPMRYGISKEIHAVLSTTLHDTRSRRIADIGGGKMGYLKTLLGHIGQIDLYLNIEISMFDIFDGIGRICMSKDSGAVDMFERSHFIDGPMQNRSTMESVPKLWKNSFDMVMSVFAIHHGCGNEADMAATIKLISYLAAPRANVMIAVYDFEKIRAKFASEGFSGELDDWNFMTGLAFQNFDYFKELAPSLINFAQSMESAGFMLTQKRDFINTGIDAMDYITVMKFSLTRDLK